MDERIQQIEQVAILGAGLLGTSVGLGLKAAGYAGRVVGVARSEETLAAAKQRGAIDHGTTDVGEAVKASQLAIVAVPLGQFDRMFQQIAEHEHDGLIITDVGSTKQSVIASAREHLKHPGRFVGAHPMAGSEQQGPEGAQADLCRGKPCIITPGNDTDEDALATVEAMWKSLGMTLIRMSAHEHDVQTATISHLPHAMAVLLVLVAAERGGWDVASTGFRDTTRLASSNPPMRADILMANREQVIEALNTLGHRLDRFIDVLDRGDRGGLLAMLEHARQVRDDWVAHRDDIE
ncbi:prephenate dehydrogenase [Phycisphaerales bacterium AB-hyl4]|uniref:Prephenate dehydrogenase n=1 Tax=Natronomicrosphaera hydrolytica TaxID=3242702 RepID=A0ABV4U2U6_9BACT